MKALFLCFLFCIVVGAQKRSYECTQSGNNYCSEGCLTAGCCGHSEVCRGLCYCYGVNSFNVNMMKGICLLLLPLTVWCYPEYQCPSLPHWNFRAMDICNNTYDYRCLWDYNKRQYVEQCDGTEYQMKGFRKIFSGGTTRSPCSEDRYQPFKYTTHGNYECIFQKSDCTEVGQVVFDNGTRISDRRCACDHSNNYAFLYPPKHQCYCEPDVDDCSCIIKTCPDQYIIDPDYNCRHVRNWSSSFRCKYPSDKISVVLSTIDKEVDQSEGPKTSKSSHKAALVVGVGIGICLLLGIITIAILHALDRKEAVEEKDKEEVKKRVKEEVEAVKEAVKEEVKEEVKRLVRNDHMRDQVHESAVDNQDYQSDDSVPSVSGRQELAVENQIYQLQELIPVVQAEQGIILSMSRESNRHRNLRVNPNLNYIELELNPASHSFHLDGDDRTIYNEINHSVIGPPAPESSESDDDRDNENEDDFMTLEHIEEILNDRGMTFRP